MRLIRIFTYVLVVSCLYCAAPIQNSRNQATKGEAYSADGIPISYEHYGSGETTIMFVHCWSCDKSYWKNQIVAFADKYHVVLLDLAGHGESGFGRERYTMKAFAQDVLAVANATKAKRIILVGHSMGGGVIAEAARLMPERVTAIVGIDTLQDVGYVPEPDEIRKVAQPFREDFISAMKSFVSTMFVESTDPQLAEWIKNDMSSAPPDVAISAFEEYLGQYTTGEAAAVFEDVQAPVHCLNATLWPTSVEGNRKHMRRFDVTIMEDVGHFPMLEKPDEFNRKLATIVVAMDTQERRRESVMARNTSPIVVEEIYGASPEVVWDAITNQEEMPKWFFKEIETFKPEVGFRTEFNVHVEGKDYLHLWEVKEAIPHKRIAYTFNFGGVEGHAVVTWELSEAEGGTRLTLTHTGLETFPQSDDPVFERESGVEGWTYFLKDSLKKHLADKH